MGRTFGLISVIVVVGLGSYIYTRQAQTTAAIGTTPLTTVNVIAVRNDLMAIANAERRYWATNARYASIEELQTSGDIEIPRQEGYAYSVEATETGFLIVASYSGPDPEAPKRISVNETMAMTSD